MRYKVLNIFNNPSFLSINQDRSNPNPSVRDLVALPTARYLRRASNLALFWEVIINVKAVTEIQAVAAQLATNE